MPTFTRRHYEVLAQILYENRPSPDNVPRWDQWNRIITALSTYFYQDNSNFKDLRFRRACQQGVARIKL